MPRLSTIVAFVCLLLIPVVAQANNCMLDPVTTHTNGMPLASSTPYRSHNVNYRCDPDHAGCCGGRYNMPCMNSLLCPNDCCTGARRPGPTWPQTKTPGVVTGVDQVQFEQIATVTVNQPGTQGARARR